MTIIISVILSIIDFASIINYKYPFLSFYFNFYSININSICSYGKPDNVEIYYRVFNIIIKIPLIYLYFYVIRSIIIRNKGYNAKF